MPFRPIALAAAAALVATALPAALSVAQAGAAARPARSAADDVVGVRLAAAAQAHGPLSRSAMLAATPLDVTTTRAPAAALRAPGEGSGGPDGSSGQTRPTAPEVAPDAGDRVAGTRPVPPRTTGKLFFKKPNGLNYVCSAAVLAHPGQNVVVTAAHCVAEAGQEAKGYHSAFRFVPAYADGTAPYGTWTATSFYTFKGWLTRSGDYAHDQALLRMAPDADDQKLEQVTGGNGMKWGEPAAGTGITAWGWPTKDPYDGETVRSCAGSTTQGTYAGVPTAVLACRMSGGAGGGPWLRPQTSKNRGYVFAVTSRRTTTGTPRLLAVPFSASMKKLYDKLAG